MINKVVLMGRLTQDPELRHVGASGDISVTSFTLAVNRPYRKDQERQADFIDVVAWRQTAEFVCRFMQKGSMAIVCGSIQTRMWQDKDGKNRKSVEVLADEVSFGESKRDSAPRVDRPFNFADNSPAETDDFSDSGDFTETISDDELPF